MLVPSTKPSPLVSAGGSSHAAAQTAAHRTAARHWAAARAAQTVAVLRPCDALALSAAEGHRVALGAALGWHVPLAGSRQAGAAQVGAGAPPQRVLCHQRRSGPSCHSRQRGQHGTKYAFHCLVLIILSFRQHRQ